MKKVANIFLVNVLQYFKNRAVFSSYIDDNEIMSILRLLSEKVPEWIKFINNDGGTILKVDHEMDANEIFRIFQNKREEEKTKKEIG